MRNGKKIKFSLIFPVYNEEKAIRRTLTHYLDAKRGHDIELIVTDDLSTDGTVEQSTRVADKIIMNPGGKRSRSANCNRGAAEASGDVLIFLDADIVIENLNLFLEEASIIFGYDTRWTGGMINHRVYRGEENLADWITHAFWNLVMRASNSFGYAISTPGFQMVTREAFASIQGFDENIGVAQDIDLCLRLNRVGKTYFFKNHCIRESPRRYRKMGYLSFALKSSKIWYNMLFKRRSFGEYEAIR